jgi:hypothetical protein
MFHDIEFLVVIDAAVDVVTEVSWVFSGRRNKREMPP